MTARPRRDWTIAAAGILLAAVVWFARGRPDLEGTEQAFAVTVVPVDRTDLACSADGAIGGLRCRYDGRGRPLGEATPPGGDRWLHPYVTTGGMVVLLSGAFAESHVAAWVAGALAAGSSERVTLTCGVKIAGTSGPVRVRWRPDGAWEDQDGLVAATVESCAVNR
ncbi:MAG TPA: hypothetical protein VHO06_00905 [Polyangia bacterium]|nr:hypothetical protein [Polyangia bacterium]